MSDSTEDSYRRSLRLMGRLAIADFVALVGLSGGLVGGLWGPAWMAVGTVIGSVLVFGVVVLYSIRRSSGTITRPAAAGGLVTKLPGLLLLKPILFLAGAIAVLGIFLGGGNFQVEKANEREFRDFQIPIFALPDSSDSVDRPAPDPAAWMESRRNAAGFWILWHCGFCLVAILQLFRFLYGKRSPIRFGGRFR